MKKTWLILILFAISLSVSGDDSYHWVRPLTTTTTTSGSCNDTNCTVSGSCPTVIYSDTDDNMTGNLNISGMLYTNLTYVTKDRCNYEDNTGDWVSRSPCDV